MTKDTSMTMMNGVGGTAVVVPSSSSKADLRNATTVVSDPSIDGLVPNSTTIPGMAMKQRFNDVVDDDFECLLLRGEESALVQAEEKLMLADDDDEEITSVESNPAEDEEVVERTMLTMALMNSVVDQKQQQLRNHGVKKDHANAENTANIVDIKQRLRKRRRRANQDLDLLEYNQSTTKVGGLAYTRSSTAHDRLVPNPLMEPPASDTALPPAATKPLARTVSQPPLPAIPPSPQFPSLLPNKTSFSVPCPLPPAALSATQPSPLVSSMEAPPVKMVNFAEPVPLPNSSSNQMLGNRMRGFSIDLDLCLEFPDDGSASMGGVSSDIVAGNTGTGGRNRAFSFECFAFGINADEPLPPLDESGVSQPDHQGSDPNITAENSILLPMTIMSSTPDHHTSNHALSNTMSSLARPRGDSIIFDPASFQDGGIHELLPGLLECGRTTELSLPPPMLARPVQPMPARPKTTKVHRTAAPPVELSTVARVASSTTIRSQPAKPHVVASSMDATSTAAEDLASGTTISLELLNKDGRIGIYLPEARIARIARFHAKRSNRIWRKRIKYDCRKKLADSRPRIKGRFVKRSDMEDDM